MRRLIFAALITAALCSAQLATKRTLTLEAAKKIAAAAAAEARNNKWTVVIAILDDGGHPIYLERMDETQVGSVEIALQKGKTSVYLKRPSKAMEDGVAGGRNAILGLPNVVPVEGGLPLMLDGKLIGAIGVSGVTSQQDGQIAKAGADAFDKMAK